MSAINKLVFNTLAKHEGINLPDIGSLKVVMHSAVMGKGGTLSAPHYDVEYVAENLPEFHSILTLIGETAEVDEEGAQNLYTEWKESVQTPQRIMIPGIGTIRDGEFTSTPQLKQALNPAGTGPVYLQKKANSTQIAIWSAVAVLLGAIIAIGLIMLLDNKRTANMRPAKTSSPTTVTTTVTESQPVGTNSSSTETTPGQTTTSTISSSGTTSAATSSSPVSIPQTNETIYHVVAGVYSTEANADRFIAKAKVANPNVTFTKRPWVNGKIMISIYQSTSRSETQVALNRLGNVEEGMWVYAQRGR